MTTSRIENGLPHGIAVDGQGVEFYVGWGAENTDVEITVEYPDYSGWSGERTAEKYLTLSREDWQEVVAFVEAEMDAKSRERADA